LPKPVPKYNLLKRAHEKKNSKEIPQEGFSNTRKRVKNGKRKKCGVKRERKNMTEPPIEKKKIW